METKKAREGRLYDRLYAIGLRYDDIRAMLKAERALHRWNEAECNGEIERDEETGKPIWRNLRANYIDPKDPRAFRTIPDRETAALKRVAAICTAHSLHFYHQGDPRGCALYVSASPMDGSNYNKGVAICY